MTQTTRLKQLLLNAMKIECDSAAYADFYATSDHDNYFNGILKFREIADMMEQALLDTITDSDGA